LFVIGIFQAGQIKEFELFIHIFHRSEFKFVPEIPGKYRVGSFYRTVVPRAAGIGEDWNNLFIKQEANRFTDCSFAAVATDEGHIIIHLDCIGNEEIIEKPLQLLLGIKMSLPRNLLVLPQFKPLAGESDEMQRFGLPFDEPLDEIEFQDEFSDLIYQCLRIMLILGASFHSFLVRLGQLEIFQGANDK